MRGHIRGRDAANMAVESNRRGPVPIEPLPADDAASVSRSRTRRRPVQLGRLTGHLAARERGGPNRVERERTAHCAPTSASKPSTKSESANATWNASARQIGERPPLLSSRRINRNNFGSHPPSGSGA